MNKPDTPRQIWLHVYCYAGAEAFYKMLWAGWVTSVPDVGNLIHVTDKLPPKPVEQVIYHFRRGSVDVLLEPDFDDEYPAWSSTIDSDAAIIS